MVIPPDTRKVMNTKSYQLDMVMSYFNCCTTKKETSESLLVQDQPVTK